MKVRLVYGKRRLQGYGFGGPEVITIGVCHTFESSKEVSNCGCVTCQPPQPHRVGIFPKVLPAKCELLCDGRIRERQSGA